MQLVDLPQDFGFTPNRVDWHYGSREESVKRVKLTVIGAVYEGRGPIETLGPKLLGWISDSKMLREAWNHPAVTGETAPGPNGHRYIDYDESEVWSKLKAMCAAIRKDTYRPGGERKVKIPKDRTDPQRGTRRFALIDIEDRVVERAVIEVLQPLFESLLGRNVLGFRVRTGGLHALALAEQQVLTESRYVLVVEDLANAFDHVPINRLLDVLSLYIPSDEVLQLLRRLLHTGRTHGIRQGSPLSPILLNIYLRHFLDEPWRARRATVPTIRVVDDHLLLCRTKKELEQVRAGLSELLNPAGMPLKVPKNSEERTVIDLRKVETATWLGFVIGKGDEGFTVQIADRAWRRLEGCMTGTDSVVVGDRAKQPIHCSAGKSAGGDTSEIHERIAAALQDLVDVGHRIGSCVAPEPPDVVGAPYIANRLACTTVWVTDMAGNGQIPKNCIVPGTGNGKPWKFYRRGIDEWLERR